MFTKKEHPSFDKIINNCINAIGMTLGVLSLENHNIDTLFSIAIYRVHIVGVLSIKSLLIISF